MSEHVPVETSMKLTVAKQRLSQVVNEVARGESRIVVEKSGLPVAAIISVEEYRRFKSQEEARRSERKALFERLARFSDAFRDVSDEDLERELASARAVIRAESDDSAQQ